MIHLDTSGQSGQLLGHGLAIWFFYSWRRCSDGAGGRVCPGDGGLDEGYGNLLHELGRMWAL